MLVRDAGTAYLSGMLGVPKSHPALARTCALVSALIWLMTTDWNGPETNLSVCYVRSVAV